MVLNVKRCLMNSVYLLPERSPPIEEVIQAGVVPRFVEFLMREDFPQLQVCYLPCLLYLIDIFIFAYLFPWLCLMFVVVWGSLGFDKYSFWNFWKHQGGNWSWCCPNFCKAPWFTQWWCPWTGTFRVPYHIFVYQ